MVNRGDTILVERCLGGDIDAFELLVGKYQKPIFNLALRMLNDYDNASDIAQETFVKAYRNLASFDRKYEFFSWLYRIAVNGCINFSKKEKRRRELNSAIVAENKTPEEIHNNRELNRLIWDVVSELKQDYRVLIMLKYYGKQSYRQIAYIINTPEKKVKSRLFEARRILHRKLEARGVLTYD